ncbi:hypothetical protein LCGC14_0681990 [marine sediment metagenome]|uniref:AAA+ ATPase domain-containing protein n=1 Tax=marine sediment metagenome TaxID=412755 RepID=A0A0F9T9A7_9ZZZZ
MGIGKRIRIKDAYKDDVGRGRIRIDPFIIKELELKTGDAIEISNPIRDKKTAALLFPGMEEDKDSNAIRIDSLLRRNLNVSIDDLIEIRKIKALPADHLTFAGLGESIIIRKSEQLVRMLENRILTKDDLISFNAMGRRMDLKVIGFSPKTDAVRIHLGTKISISEKKYKELIEIENRKVSYNDIGGLNNEIQKVRDIVELPLKHPELFKAMGIAPPKSILLHGPPGTGKTLLVRAVAYTADAHFIHITGPELLSKFHGQSEENLRKIFEEAKEMAPSIIFIDQLDSITPNRDKLTSQRERGLIAQLLSLLDGFEARGDIIFIAETNKIDHIDSSFRRPGRFDREIEIKVPDMEGRYEILKIITRPVPLSKDVDLKIIAEKTKGFVGSDLNALVKEAALLPIKEILPQIDYEKPISHEILGKLQIKMEHFLIVLEKIETSSTK